MTAAWRSMALLAAVLAGVGAAKLLGISDADKSPVYETFVTALLGFGLYASTRGIVVAEFRSQIRTVLLAVTLGVLAKATLIFGVMYLVFGDSDYLVLGIAVAQIDPLSVAAVQAKSRMSDSAKALLAAWASFDDPITVLLTAYFTVFALQARGTSSGDGALADGLLSFAQNLGWNLLLAGAVYLAWRVGKKLRQGRAVRAASEGRAARLALRCLLLLAVLGVGVLAVQFSLLLALAIIGLFFRPEMGRWLDRMTHLAMFAATFAVGLVLVGGIRPVEGAVLGAAAYAAQIVTALVLTLPRVWRGDRARLALSQQNGMTAIILALLLEPDFPGTIAIVAPAIVVVNLLHAVCNGIWDRLRPPSPADEATEDRPNTTEPDEDATPGRLASLTAFSSRWRARPAARPAERAG